jgi:hypothetical protein
MVNIEFEYDALFGVFKGTPYYNRRKSVMPEMR